MMIIRTLLSGLAFLCAVGCGSPDQSLNPNDPGNGNGNGNNCNSEMVDYPTDNCGYSIGQRISNVSFYVHANGVSDVGKDPVRITMADFYAKRTSGAKLLLLSGAAEWCNPCKQEAMTLVSALQDPTFQSFLQSQGGPQSLQIAELVMQNYDTSPADAGTMDRWATAFKIPFTVGFDPKGSVAKYIPANEIPVSLYVRLKDMTIIYREVGAAPDPNAFIDEVKKYLMQAGN